MSAFQILVGDCRDLLTKLPERSVRCVVTSPPYWGLRDYGVAGQLDLEPTLREYLASIVDVFQAIRRVLADDGTCWVNVGDCHVASHAGGPVGASTLEGSQESQAQSKQAKKSWRRDRALLATEPHRACAGLKPKDLVGLPWRVAFALQEDGWYLRSDIVWHKPNPMPESVRDRPTRAHEFVFLLAKSERYFYDQAAISEPVTGGAHSRGAGVHPKARKPSGWATGSERRTHIELSGRYGVARELQDKREGRSRTRTGINERWKVRANASFCAAVKDVVDVRNKRTVWTIPTQPFNGAHFATFPEALVEPCVLAGSARGDTVLDPFCGSGTTGLVARRFGRDFVGLELNAAYAKLARRRCASVQLELPIVGAKPEAIA